MFYEVKSHGVTIEMTRNLVEKQKVYEESTTSTVCKGIYKLSPVGLKIKIK